MVTIVATADRDATRAKKIKWALLVAALACMAIGVGVLFRNLQKAAGTAAQAPTPSGRQSPAGAVRVETVKPKSGGVEHTTSQIGSVYAFETAELYAKVSGFLKTQTVDIGDRVKQGQVLVELEAPELDIEVLESRAALAQAEAELAQTESRVKTAEADRQAALTNVTKSEAELGSAKAQRAFHEKQFARIKSLYELNSAEERLVDEKQSEMEAARSAEAAAAAEIENAKALAIAAGAKVEQAKADVKNSQAKIKVAQATLKKAEVFVNYLKITAPFDGVITKRSFDTGDFIRAAERGGEAAMLAVAKTDVMRVVIQMPDTLVPLVDRGDNAVVQIDALPNRDFPGKIARMAKAEDTQSRTMRVEVDLPNSGGNIYPGMFGRVTIKLQSPSSALTIPSSCLIGSAEEGKGSVYVVRDGKAHLTPIAISADDGLDVEVSGGLRPDDDVVESYNGAIGDGLAVEVAP